MHKILYFSMTPACFHTGMHTPPHRANMLQLFYFHTETKLWNKPCLFRNRPSVRKETKSHPALCYPAEKSQITLPGATKFSEH